MGTRRVSWLFVLSLFSICFAQAPRGPNLDAQRAAMKKLEFMAGKWCGEARVWRGPNDVLELTQTEDVQYKLDGLIMVTEGTGRNKSDGKVVFRAFAVASFDEETGTYRMRAYNDGRYMETDLKLSDNGRGFTWGFTFGQIKTRYTMTMTEKGEWTETGEAIIGTQPPRKFVELTVRRQN